MSDTDSFIEEVTEEVRRERLFQLAKRYGWIAVLAIVLVVGGVAWNESRKASKMRAAQAFGDSLLSALDADDPIKRSAALAEVEAPNAGGAAVVALLQAKADVASGNIDQAVAALEALSNNADVPLIYRQVASFRALGLQAPTLSADARRAGYETLIGGNTQLRLLAEEQIALIDVEEGKTEAALDGLNAILADAGATAGMKRRATQMIVALGGALSEDGAEPSDG